MKMKSASYHNMQRLFIGLALMISCCNGFIVPQELPSVLSLVYSNIPQIKKGTDSRVGFGFRLGEHADFQVLLELGPQKFTKPLGDGSGSESSDTSKRMVDQNDYHKKVKPANMSGKQWLNNWASDMKSETKRNSQKIQMNVMEHNPLRTMFSTAEQIPIPKTPVIADSALRQLQQLYGKTNDQTSATTITSIGNYFENSEGTHPAQSMIEHIRAAQQQQTRLKKDKIKSDLMNVSFD